VTVLYGGLNVDVKQDTWTWNGTLWTHKTDSGPGKRYCAVMAYDSIRHSTVLFGGYNGSEWLADTWEWNGTIWQQRATSGPGPRQYTSMAFDETHGKCVCLAGEVRTTTPGNGMALHGPIAVWSPRGA